MFVTGREKNVTDNHYSINYALNSSPTHSPSNSSRPPRAEIKIEHEESNEIKINIDDNELDEEFIEHLRKHKIKSILESVFSDTYVTNSFLSILTFANAARNFPVIRKLVYDALKQIIYYVCSLHEEVIKALALEAATVGSEAVGYTNTFVVTGSALLVLLLTYQGLKYPFSYSKKKAFQETLEELGLDPKIFSKFSNISEQQISDLTILIKSKITHDKELVNALLSVYFDNLDDKKLVAFSAHVKVHKLKNSIMNNLVVKPSCWQAFTANTEWYLNEISRYRIPIAAMCAASGLVLMVQKSISIGADLGTLITDTAPVADQANVESLEIYPWILGSGPVILFHSLALSAYLATRLPHLNKMAIGFYNKVHAPIEKWAKDSEHWLYHELGKQIILIPAIPAITTYAAIKSLDFGERYATAVGCDSVGGVFKSIITNTADPKGKCMTTTKANLIAVLVGDSEFDKFYLFYALLLVTYYPVMALIERFSSLKEWLPREKARKIYDEFKKMNKNSYHFAGSITFVAAWLAFYIAKRFADHIPEEGLQVAYDLNDYITPNMTLPNMTLPDVHIDNSTIPVILKTMCPNADLGQIISDALEKLPIPHNITELQEYVSNLNISKLSNSTFPDIPIKFINNSTIVATLVEACPQYGVLTFFLLDLAGIAADCNPLIEYRTLAAFVTLFWMAVSYTGGGSYSIGTAVQLLGWGVSAVKNWWHGVDNNPEAEMKKEPILSESNADSLHEPLLLSQAESKAGTWSGYCNSLYNFFYCKNNKSSSTADAANNTPTAHSDEPSPVEKMNNTVNHFRSQTA